MPIPAYRGFSTATGTTSITVPVPTGTADGDGLVLAILNDAGSAGWSGTISGWTTGSSVSGTRFRGFAKIWHTGDPTSVTVSIPAATAIAALMYGFEAAALLFAPGSIPGGGPDVTKIECPGGTGPIYLGFGGIINATNPQTTPLTGDSPLGEVVNVGNGPVWLAGGWDIANNATSRFFSGVTAPAVNPGDIRSGLGMRLDVDTTTPVGGWGVGQVRMGTG